MSGLWTPEGERPAPTPATATPETVPEAGFPSTATSEEEEALLRELARAEEQLLAAPVEDVVANHCYGLFQLAALHLGQSPPNLSAARLAIDALAALVDGVGERLGASSETLLDGLAQIRLAYVQIAGATAGTNGSGSPEHPPTASADPDGAPPAERT
jgi:hypothetical protein